mgnify:CR=1 FL=1
MQHDNTREPARRGSGRKKRPHQVEMSARGQVSEAPCEEEGGRTLEARGDGVEARFRAKEVVVDVGEAGVREMVPPANAGVSLSSKRR